MVTRYSFDCPICGKHYEIKGKWYNQCVIHHYLDTKYFMHCIYKKEYKNKKIIYTFLKMILIWFPLLLMQLFELLLEPFRRLYE